MGPRPSRFGLVTVALLARGARQRRLDVSFKVFGKVGRDLRGWPCYSPWVRMARRPRPRNRHAAHASLSGLARVPIVGRSVVECGGLRAVRSATAAGRRYGGAVLYNAPRTLASNGHLILTRLETRTKESNMCASLWVSETSQAQ